MKAIPLFSIIIPTLNEEVALPQLLNDLSNQVFKDFSVTVVDANSSDNTFQILKKYKSTVPYPLSPIQTSYRNVSIQRNLGASYSQSSWLLFIDADTRIEPNCLSKINHELLKQPDIDLFTTSIKSLTDSVIDQVCISATNISFHIGQVVGLPRCFGAFTGVKRSVFDAMQGYNPALTYREDVTLIRQAVKLGYRFHVITSTNYIFSLRRLRQHGYIKTISKYIELNFKHTIGKINIDSTEYPMGGHLYPKDLTSP